MIFKNVYCGLKKKQKVQKVHFTGFTRIKLYAKNFSTEIVWSAMQNETVKYLLSHTVSYQELINTMKETRTNKMSGKFKKKFK